MESFSDAVFAVAITLLVLSLRLPARHIPDTQLWQYLQDQWPYFFAYVLSFVIIGGFWISHHLFFSQIERHDSGFVWLNLLFLMLIVFIPFPTIVLSEYGDTVTGTVLYALSIAAASLVLSLMIWYAVGDRRLVSDTFERRMGMHLILQYLNVAGVFLVSVGIAYINTDAAKYFWLLIWVISRVLDVLFRRKVRAAEA
jgi:uncharacterized membrane protein